MAKVTSPFQFLQTVRATDERDMEPNSSPYRLGTVTGYGMGNSTAQVRMDGEEADSITDCTFVTTYTPWVNDRVLLARMGTSLSKEKNVIVGRVNGTPDRMHKQKDLDQNVTNATLINDNDLLLPLEADAFYKFRAVLFCFGTTNADIKVAFGVQSAWITDWGVHAGSVLTTSAGNTDFALVSRGQTGVTTTNSYSWSTVTNVDTVALVFDFIQTGASAGTFQLKFAKNAAVETDTWLLARSWLETERVG